ncbi:MAG: 4-(cytidine 5'-diphospho)-2-C-methyl-D-erythritol kinase, partial [Absicoccus porci]
MKVYAPAKVNLALDVIGKNEQGYHDLDMIMAP